MQLSADTKVDQLAQHVFLFQIGVTFIDVVQFDVDEIR